MESQKFTPHTKPSPVSSGENQGRLMRFVRAHKADIAFIAYCAVVGTAGVLIFDKLHNENMEKLQEYKQAHPPKIEQMAPRKPGAMVQTTGRKHSEKPGAMA